MPTAAGGWYDDKTVRLVGYVDLNRPIARLQQQGYNRFDLDDRLLGAGVALDLRLVVSTLAAPRRTFEASVIEPTGERSGKDHPRTTLGGLMEGDALLWEYTLPKARPGVYAVQLSFRPSYNAYLADQRRTGRESPPPEPDAVFITVYRDLGRATESRRVLCVPVTGESGSVRAAEIRF